jgi:diguanylate cyclase (GGDEF)-like protein
MTAKPRQFLDWARSANGIEFFAFVAWGIFAWKFTTVFNTFEQMYLLARSHDSWMLDEAFMLMFCLSFAFMVGVVRRSNLLRSEIERRQVAEQQADALARHDVLTGLPNRRVLTDELGKMIARGQREVRPFAVLLIDLDRFKPINDIHGHAAGDATLCEIADRLKSMMRKGEMAARLGGDEFVLLMEAGSEQAMRAANRILTRLREPITIDRLKVSVDCTIGIAMFPGDGRDPDELLHAADLAMYRAKKEERGTFRFFEASMDTDLRARAAMEAELRRAIPAGEIKPHYQPVFALENRSLLGFEVLARWHHPDRGLLPPSVFITVAEDTGLIAELSYEILRQACLDAKAWPSHLMLAVNISPLQLRDRSLAPRILAILHETGFPPQRLEIEITENALVADLDLARATLSALQNLGISVALDDFGTGYSSLYHLRELRFDKIKIDRSFVQTMSYNEESAKIVDAIVGLGKSMGLLTTAEGVETPEHMQKLNQLGCEYAQGFHLGKPMPNALALDLIHAERQSSAA